MAKKDYRDLVNAELYAFQKEGVKFALRHHYNCIADEMGCLAGDTLIKINRAGCSREYTLKQVYERSNGSWLKRPDIKSKVRAFNGDAIQLHNMVKVVESGVKSVIRLVLENKSIKLTGDHEVLTKRGWIEAKDLTTSDEVMVDNIERYKTKKSKVLRNKPRYSLRDVGEYYPYGHYIKRRGKKVKRAEAHILQYYAYSHHISLDELVFRTYREDFTKCFKIRDTKEWHVHHKDHDVKNNSETNLELLSAREHNKLHGKYGHFGHGVPEYEKVMTVQGAGFEMTYDIVCEDPHRNFVANGIVVHNCGKTLQAITLSLITESKTLVFCPSYLKNTWKKEYDKFSKMFLRVAIVKSGKDLDNLEIDKFDVVIVSYGLIKHSEKLFEWATLVVADEANYLFNEKAQRTKAFHKHLYEYSPERFVALTGTPIKNRVTEYYSLLKLLSYSPEATNGKRIEEHFPTFSSFANKFSHKKTFEINGTYITQYKGTRNVELLKTYLRDKFIRRLAKDHLELPDFIRKDVIVDYRTEDDEQAWVDFQSGKEAGSSAKAESALHKSKFSSNYVDELLKSGEGPVVVFSAHVAPTEFIAEYLQGKGYSVGFIDGSVSPSAREKIVSEFQDGLYDALAATIGAASTGFTLTRSNNLVFNDQSYVVGDNNQAEKRIHRIGQTRPCLIHRIVGGRIDERILKALDEKSETIRRVT